MTDLSSLQQPAAAPPHHREGPRGHHPSGAIEGPACPEPMCQGKNFSKDFSCLPLCSLRLVEHAHSSKRTVSVQKSSHPMMKTCLLLKSTNLPDILISVHLSLGKQSSVNPSHHSQQPQALCSAQACPASVYACCSEPSNSPGGNRASLSLAQLSLSSWL